MSVKPGKKLPKRVTTVRHQECRKASWIRGQERKERRRLFDIAANVRNNAILFSMASDYIQVMAGSPEHIRKFLTKTAIREMLKTHRERRHRRASYLD